MMRIAAAILAPTLALAGCAASIPPAQVTRFHLDQPIVPGGFALEPAPAGLEAAGYRTAVTEQLKRLGFSETAVARYTVSVSAARDERDAGPRRSPVTIGVGGGTGGYGGGVGAGVSFGLGGNRSKTDVVTRLSVRIVERSGGATIWEGRAETVAPASAPAAQPGLAAGKLASALFKDFPGISGRTISVP
jgi:hypothetical protein